MIDYIDTYYRRTSGEIAARPELTEDVKAEIAVVGGGLAGLTTALELARRGKSVVVLEARRVAWGASGRNGGFCAPGFATSLKKIIAKAGLATARELYALSHDAVDYVRGNITQLEVPRNPVTEGLIWAKRHPSLAEVEGFRDFMAQNFDTKLDVFSIEETRARLNSQRYFESIHQPHAFAFHPLLYALALAREIERLGGRIYEQSPAIQYGTTQQGHVLVSAKGRIVAEHVVFCGGGYTDRLMPKLFDTVLPIATYVMLTESLGSELDDAIRCRHCIADDRLANDYYRVVEDRRILWGGKITTRISDPNDLAERLRQNMVEVYPQLSGVKISVAWSGQMAYAIHTMPQIGTLGHGLWYCTGFGGHGMNTTALGGRLIAGAITEGDNRYRLFEPFGLNWNGGPLGRLAVQLVYWKLQFQDWWAERRVA